MKATIAWWDLDSSEQTIDSLRIYLRDEGVRPWAGVRGLRLKFWISDRLTNHWGAVMLWESTADLKAPMPPHRAAELIGYPPTHRMTVDVEATIEGIHVAHPLNNLGLAFESAAQVSGGLL
jgi:trans-2,3-dihydro-3-hydroxyanthranilate isomerase